MSGPGAGFEYPERQVAWNQRDVLLFANSIGCTSADELHFLYVCLQLCPLLSVLSDRIFRNCTQTSLLSLHTQSFSVSYPSFKVLNIVQHFSNTSPAFKGTSQEVIDFYASQKATPIPGVPKFDPTRVVDGQRIMTFYNPFPTTSEGRTFVLKSKVIGVYDKGKSGAVVETQQDIVDKRTGEIYTRAVGSAFFMGQGNWGGPKGPASKSFPAPSSPPDASVIHQLTAESALLYRYDICPSYI